MASYDFHDFSRLSTAEIYRWMVGVIIPRPIAWVSTVGDDGTVNLAPFSFFNGVCSNPPTIAVSIARKRDGTKKDTLRNIESNSEFVVNTAIRSEAIRINETSRPYPPEISELAATSSTVLPSSFVKPPRIAESPAQFECKLDQIVDIGEPGTPGSAALVLGRVLCLHISKDVIRDGRVDPKLLDPVSRLGGTSWGTLGEVFSLPRAD